MQDRFTKRIQAAATALVFSVCFTTYLRAQVKAPVNKSAHLELTAKLDHEAIKSGEKAPITFHLKNISSEDVAVSMTEPGYDILLQVVDDKNGAIPLTRLGRAVRYSLRKITHGRAEMLKPGADSTFALDIAELYEIGRPGIYYIIGSYEGLIYLDRNPDSKKEPVSSDRVKLAVTQ